MKTERSTCTRLRWIASLAGLFILVMLMAACDLLPAPAVDTPAPIMIPVVSGTPSPFPVTTGPELTPAPTPSPALSISASLPQPVSYLTAGSDDDTQLRLVDDTGDHLLAIDEEGFTTLIWSPDNRQGIVTVLFGVERALSIIDIPSRKTLRLLTGAPSGRLAFRVASDWSRIVVQRSGGAENELWVVDLPAGVPRQLTLTQGVLAEWDISGDGRWVLAGIEAEGRYVTSLFDTMGTVVHEISEIPHLIAEFSTDGRWLILTGRAAGESLEKMQLFDLDSMGEEVEARIVAVGTGIRPAVKREGEINSYFSADASWLGTVIENDNGNRVRLRELGTSERIDLNLESGESLDWLLAYPSLRRGLIATSGADNMKGLSRLRLWYPDQRVEIPLIEGVESLDLLPGWAGGTAIADAIQPDGRRLIAVVDVPNGSSHIVLRGGVWPLDLDPAGGRALVGLGQAGRSLVHLLDLNVGGTLVDVGFSLGGEDRPAAGRFAPFGPAFWAKLWRSDGATILKVNAQGAGPAITVTDGVDEVIFSPAGSSLVFAKGGTHAGGIYLVRSDGAGQRFLATGYAPRWHPAP